MRTKIKVSSFFVVVFMAIAPNAHSVDPIRNFQVDVIAINTPLGSPTVTEAMSKAVIDKVNQGMDDSTGGLIHFTFRSVLAPITASMPITSSTDVGTVTGITPKADTGYEGAILIGVITNNPSNLFAGMAGGSFMLINGTWDLNSAWILSHEFGHNLGVMHANAAVCTTTLPITCDQKEYGDYSSTMGTYINAITSQPFISRYSGTELDELKVLPANKKVEVTESGEFKLAPLYSQNLDLPKVLYIPIGNENTYSIEYRPAYGNETNLASSQLPFNGLLYPNIPTYGLQLRIMYTFGTQYASLQPKMNNIPRFGTALVSDSLSGPLVQPDGKTFLLSDGSTVTFVSTDPIAGAVVKIVRPVDTEAPKNLSVKAQWPFVAYYTGLKGERLVQHKSPGIWDYPKLTIPVQDGGDNRLLKTIELEINGKIVDSRTNDGVVGLKEFTYQTTGVGDFAIRLIATDYAGNKTLGDISNYSTGYYYLRKAGVVINEGRNSQSSIEISFYRFGKDTTYQLTDLSAGTIQSTVIDDELIKITIINIPRNTTITAKLTGTNAAGETDGGQILTNKPANTECTNTQCFVAMPWNVDAGSWSAGVGILSLQEKVGSKWVSVKSAKPLTGFSKIRNYPVTYSMKLTYSAPGKHVYRFIIAASKKFGAYTGPTFTQIVKP
jgi:hypothetical protein